MSDETSATQTESTEEKTPTFTQDQVSAIASKAEKKAQEKLLSEFGFSTADEAKEILSALREHQEKQKTAEERLATLSQEREQLGGKVSRYESTIKSLLETEVEQIPEDKRSLIPDYDDPAKSLDWVVRNRGILVEVKHGPVNVGTGNSPAPTQQVNPYTFDEFKTLDTETRKNFHEKYPEIAKGYTERLRSGAK